MRRPAPPKLLSCLAPALLLFCVQLLSTQVVDFDKMGARRVAVWILSQSCAMILSIAGGLYIYRQRVRQHHELLKLIETLQREEYR